MIVMNYVHHTPIIENKVPNFDTTFLEIHDITSIQQRIRTNDNDESRFEESLRMEVDDLSRFQHKYTLSVNEVNLLAERGCPIEEHSYLDVFIRNAVTPKEDLAVTLANQYPILNKEYLCVVGSDHPSNVMEIAQFCERESLNVDRKLPIVICGLVCRQITIPEETLTRAGIHLLGFVDDIATVIRNSLATLNPVNIGSGTPIKVLDSIANDTPCMATERTVVAMQPHPLVVTYDFLSNPIVDEHVRRLAHIARGEFQRLRGTELIKCNKLGVFLNEHRPR
jgi:hypothetical protein